MHVGRWRLERGAQQAIACDHDGVYRIENRGYGTIYLLESPKAGAAGPAPKTSSTTHLLRPEESIDLPIRGTILTLEARSGCSHGTIERLLSIVG